jgi:hypothetical protein
MKTNVKIIVAAMCTAGLISPSLALADTITPVSPPGTVAPAAQTPTPPANTITTFPVSVVVPGVGATVLNLKYNNTTGVWDTGNAAWTFNANVNNDKNTAVFSTTTPNGTVYSFALSNQTPGNTPPFGPATGTPAVTVGPSVGVDYTSPLPSPTVTSSLIGPAAATGKITGLGQTSAPLNGPAYVAAPVGTNPPGVPPLVVTAGPGSSASSAAAGTSPVGSAGGVVNVAATNANQSISFGQYAVTVPTTPTPAGTTTVNGTVAGTSGSFNSTTGLSMNTIGGTATYNTKTGVIETTATTTPTVSITPNGNALFAGNLGVGGNAFINGSLSAGKTSTAGLVNTGAMSTDTLTVTGATVTNGITNAGAINTGSLNVLNNTLLNGNLAVAGKTSTAGLVNTGAMSTTTLTVTGTTSTNGLVNTGATSTTTLAVTGAATVGGTLGVTGATTLSSTLAVAGNTTIGGNSAVTGNSTVGGTLGVTGATTIGGATQINNTLGVTGATNIGSASGTNGNTLRVDGTGVAMSTPAISGSSASSVVVSNAGTALVGGGAGFTLANGRATFGAVNGGGPLRVTGIANGENQYDAVNYGQFQELEKNMSRGISGASAMANIPQVDQSKAFNLGIGVGGFNGETAFAIGGSARVAKDGILKASVGFAGGGGSNTTWGVGGGWSW